MLSAEVPLLLGEAQQADGPRGVTATASGGLPPRS